MVFESVNAENWGRCIAIASTQVTKAKRQEIMEKWNVDSFPLGRYCDFQRLHKLITGKGLPDYLESQIQVKLATPGNKLKSDEDRWAQDLYIAVKTLDLRALRKVLQSIKSAPCNSKFFRAIPKICK